MAAATIPRTVDLTVRRSIAWGKADVARLYLKDALQALDCSELREQHAAVGNAIASLDDVIGAVKS